MLIQSNDGVAHFDLSVALAARQDVVGATTHFRQAVELLPDNVAMWVNLGAVLASEDKLDEAIRHLRLALRFEPDDLDALMNLGVALGSLGEFTEAAVQFRRVVAIDPSHAGGHARLAQVLIELSGPGQATEYLERAIMLDPDDRDSMIRLVWLYATCPVPEVRNGLRAVELGERLQAMPGGQDPKMLDVLAAAYAPQGKYSEATRVATTALRRIGDNNPGYAKEIRKQLEFYCERKPFRGNP